MKIKMCDDKNIIINFRNDLKNNKNKIKEQVNKYINAYWPEVAVGGGTENYGGYSNIKWENVWLVVLTKKRLNEIYLNYGVRPKTNICYVAKIFNGCKMYMVCGLNCNEYDTTYFHTKKEAASFIRENFTGDAKRIRLYDLKRA